MSSALRAIKGLVEERRFEGKRSPAAWPDRPLQREFASLNMIIIACIGGHSVPVLSATGLPVSLEIRSICDMGGGTRVALIDGSPECEDETCVGVPLVDNHHTRVATAPPKIDRRHLYSERGAGEIGRRAHEHDTIRSGRGSVGLRECVMHFAGRANNSPAWVLQTPH